MPRAYILVLLFALAVPTRALGQDRQGHVWAVIELRAHPGQESAYLEAIRRFDDPILEEVIRRGRAVGHTFLVKQPEPGEDGSYLVIIEFASRDDYDNVSEVLDDVSRSLFGRPYTQLAAEEYARCDQEGGLPRADAGQVTTSHVASPPLMPDWRSAPARRTRAFRQGLEPDIAAGRVEVVRLHLTTAGRHVAPAGRIQRRQAEAGRMEHPGAMRKWEALRRRSAAGRVS